MFIGLLEPVGIGRITEGPD